MIVRHCLFLVILFFLPSMNSLATFSNISDVDTISRELHDSGIAGFSVAILDKSGLIWSKGYGYADVKKKLPMSPNTIQNIASISKTVTGVAVMNLVERGKLDLDENINTYLPFSVTHPIFPKIPITARQLLTHTSGIVDRSSVYEGALSYHYGEDNPVKLGQFLRDYFSSKNNLYSINNFSDYAPGTKSNYSNIAYGLVAYLVESITKMPFGEFTKNNIFVPLGMDSTAWMLSDVNLNHHARLYTFNNNSLKEIEWYGLVTWPDGGLRTSVSDFSKFIIAMLNEGSYNGIRILQKKTLQAMFTPQFSEGSVLSSVKESNQFRQAITWTVLQQKNVGKIIGHSGYDPGVMTFAYFDPNTGRAVVLFLNTDSEEEVIGKAVSKYMDSMLVLMNQMKTTDKSN